MYLLSFFCLFFFFKQKTAYEMRISDWSSDVCSSDLATPGPVGDAERAAYGAAFDVLKAGRYDESANMFQDFLRQFPQGGLVPNEIGRASCRERVCQYV